MSNFPVKTTFTFNHSAEPDVLTPGFISSTTLKADFDSRAQENLDFINSILAVLTSVTAGSSGSDNIGAATISGVAGNTTAAQISDLRAQILAIVGGAIPPSSVTTAMIQDLAITFAKEDTAGQLARIGGLVYAYKNLGGF